MRAASAILALVAVTAVLFTGATAVFGGDTSGATSDPVMKYRCTGVKVVKIVHGALKTRVRDFATNALLFTSTRTGPQPVAGKCVSVAIAPGDHVGNHGFGQSTIKGLQCTFPSQTIIWYQHGVDENNKDNAKIYVGYAHEFYMWDRQSPDSNTSFDDNKCKEIP